MQTNVIRTLTVRAQQQGLEKLAADLGKVGEAQSRVTKTSDQLTKVTDTTAKRQLSAAGAYERMMERTDRLHYLQRQLEREMNVVNRAFEQGAIDATQHARSVDVVTARFERLVSVEAQARAQLAGTTAAMDQQAAAAHRLAAANDNASASMNGMGANTANIAAQFQDIGVTAAMGMSPVMIALQQGTQLSAVFNSMQNPIKGVATALMSILNPVSLLTIGFVALSAAAIQYFTAMGNAGESVDKIREQNDLIRSVAENWGDAVPALKAYVDQLDRAADVSDLNKATDTAVRMEFSDLQRQLGDWRAALAEARIDIQAFGGDAQEIDALQKTFQTLEDRMRAGTATTADLEAVLAALAGTTGSQTIPSLLGFQSILQSVAGALAAAAGNAAQLRAERDALLMEGPDPALFYNQKDFIAEQERLNGLTTEELRLEREITRVRAEAERGDVLLSDQQALDLANDRLAAEERRQALTRTGTSAVRETEKMAGNYADLTRKSQEFIAGQQLQAQALGMSAEATSRMRHEQDLLNQAANDNIALSPAQRGELSALAAEMAAVEERTRGLNEVYTFGQSTLSGALSSLRRDLMNGTSLWDSFGNAAAGAFDKIADRAMNMAANGIWDLLFNSVMSGLGGGFGTIGVGGVGMPAGGFVPGLTGPSLPSFDGGGWTGDGPRTGGLDGMGGFLAVMHPRERVYDTTRVLPANQDQSNDNWPSIQIIDQRGGKAPAIKQERGIGANGEKQLRLIIRDEVHEAQRRGVPGFGFGG